VPGRREAREESSLAPHALQIGEWDRDENLIAAVGAGAEPRLRVEQHPDTVIVLGRGSRPEAELNLEQVIADSAIVERRRGGGCAVVLDPGNLVVSVVLPLPGITRIRESHDQLTDWLITGLENAGVPDVQRAGSSDLALGNRKLGGSCIWRRPGLLYYSTTLLVAPDLDLVERWLVHPPREPDYRAGRPHRAFMTSLSEAIGVRSAADFAERLQAALDTLPSF